VEKQQLLGEILGFRKMLEPALAADAAVHASAMAIADLEECLDRQEEKIGRGGTAVEEDCEFHYRIAVASGNNIAVRVLDMLMYLLLETREHSLQVGGRPQKSLAGHQRILAAIKQHDAAATYGAMRRHVQDVEKIVRSSF
jgi:GntR family transcriptional regulator, transcriptional repressor for pyruvate dehydrogenase complex